MSWLSLFISVPTSQEHKFSQFLLLVYLEDSKFLAKMLWEERVNLRPHPGSTTECLLYEKGNLWMHPARCCPMDQTRSYLYSIWEMWRCNYLEFGDDLCFWNYFMLSAWRRLKSLQELWFLHSVGVLHLCFWLKWQLSFVAYACSAMQFQNSLLSSQRDLRKAPRRISWQVYV